MENLDQTQLWLLLLAVAATAFMMGRATGGGMSAEEREQKRIQEQQEADRVFASLSPEVQQEIDAKIQAGKTIEAIKQVREHTGSGLKDAKQAVDARRNAMGLR